MDTTTITLPEAIRLGAMMHPQAFGVFFSRADCVEKRDGKLYRAVHATCALASAQMAVREDDGYGIALRWLQTRFPILEQATCCPVNGCKYHEEEQGYSVSDVIPHLNDGHRWTREQIADWVETLEHTHDVPVVDAAVSV